MEKLHPKSFICRRIYIGKTQNYQELTLGHIKMITWVSTLLHSHRSTTIREGQTQWWDFWYPQNFFWNIASWKTCAIHCLNLWILASALSVSFTPALVSIALISQFFEHKNHSWFWPNLAFLIQFLLWVSFFHAFSGRTEPSINFYVL